MTFATRNNRFGGHHLRGGRLTKVKGVVASYAPVIGIAMTIMMPGVAAAQTLEWDANGATSNGTVEGGTGDWDDTTANWTSDAGTTNETWTDGSNAVFGGTAGTVTVVGTQDVENITFQTGGYTVTGGALNYTNSGNGITTSGGTTTIASDITSTTGLQKSGDGTLVLSGANTITGQLNLARGNLTATNADVFDDVTSIFAQSSNSIINLDLGGASASVSNLSFNAQGSSSLSNGTVDVSNLVIVGYGNINTTLTGTARIEKQLIGTTTFNAVNTISGPLDIRAGRVRVSSTGSLGGITDIEIRAGVLEVDGGGNNALNDAALIDNSGILRLTGSDETVGGIFGAGDVELNDNDLTFGDATDREIAGAVSGTGDFIYQGTGALTMSGDSTMTGDMVNIGGGTYILSGSTTGGVVNTDGTFDNSGAIGGTVSNGALGTFNALAGSTYGGDIDNDGQFNIGASSFALNGVFTNNGTVTNTSGATIAFAVGTGANFINNGTLDGGAGASEILLTGDAYTIGATSQILGNVTIDVDNLTTNADFDISGTTDYNFTNNATATVVADANFSGGDLTNTDTVNVSDGNLIGVGVLDNTGTVNIGDGAGTARTLEAETITNAGIINVNGGSSLIGTGNTTNNSGVVNIAGGGSLVELVGDYNNEATGEVNFNDAGPKTFDVQTGIITNEGDLNFNGGVTTVNSAGGAIQNNDGVGRGAINIADGATMDATGDTIENAADITMAGAGSVLIVDTLNNNTGGVVDAQGTLTAEVVNAGDFEAVGSLTHTGNFTNNAGGTLAVTAGTMDTSGDVINNSGGTGTTITTAGVQVAAGAELEANTITNNSGATMAVAGTLDSTSGTAGAIANDGTMIVDATGIVLGNVDNTGALNSTGQLNEGLTNSGTASVQGQLLGVVQNDAGGQLNIDGNLVMDNDLTNASGGEVDVNAGTVTGLSLLINVGTGTGTGAGTAGFEIDSGAAVNADNVLNAGTGTMFVAGTLNSTSGQISNGADATLTSTGTMTGGLSTSGTATVQGTLLGVVDNTAGGQLTIDGDLVMDNALTNEAGAVTDVTAGEVTGLTALTNNGAGSGTGAGQAGFEINAGATVNATDTANTGTMYVAGVLNSTNAITNSATGTFTSVGDVSGGLTNDGLAVVSGELLGAVQNNAGGQLTVDGDLVMDDTLTNAAGGEVDVDAGTVTGLTTLSNAGAGTGTDAGAAGFEIDAGATVNAVDTTNTGTMFIAGTLNSTNAVNNSDTLTSIGTVTGGVNNISDVFMEGILDGDVLNEGGTFTVTGDLAGTGGAASGNFTNSDVGTLVMTAGTTFTFDTLDNDASSLVELNDGTLDGAVNNEGTVVQSGTITGALVNNGLFDMADAETGDVVSALSGLTSTGTYDYDLDLSLATPGSDLFEVTGATTGTLALQFETFPGDPHLLADALVVFDVDEAAANDFTFTATGLDRDASPVSVFTIQDGLNGDISVQTGVSLSLGAIMEGVAQTEGLSSLQAGSLAPHVTDCGSLGGWGRFTGGETTTATTARNIGQEGDLDVTTDHRGFQLGANLGCTNTAGGWDISYNLLAGGNSGSSSQDLTRDGMMVGTTTLDFDQLYAGFYGAATNGDVTADLQISYGQTDYDVDEGGIDLGLTDTEFSSQTVKLAGSVSYVYPLNDRGLSLTPHGGFSWASTSIDDLSFDPGQTLETDDFTNTSGFAGVTLNNAFVNDDGVLNTFAAATYYGALSAEQSATLVETNGIEGEVSTSGVSEFGELSLGVDYTRALGGTREFNAAFRVDSQFGEDIEGYNVALELGVRF